jgi:hypothetical protein
MDFTSPQNMMTTLIGETRSALINLMEKSKLSLDEVCSQSKSIKPGVLPTVDQLEIAEILRYLWSNWITIKDKLFSCDFTNGYGAEYKSYISIILTARNKWAHKNNLTYEDVLHNGFVVQHFFRSANREVNISVIDQIVEACIQELGGMRATIPALAPQIDVNNSVALHQNLDVAEETIEQSVIDKENLIGNREVVTESAKSIRDIIEEQEEGVGEEGDEKSLSGNLLVHEEMVEIDDESTEEFSGVTDEEIDEFLEFEEQSSDEEELAEVEEQEEEIITPDTQRKIDLLKRLVDQQNYRKLSWMMGFKKKPKVEEGNYPNTLYITAEGPIWGSWGIEKLKLIEENLFWVALFALHGIIPLEMKGSWDGKDMICLPSVDHTRVQFGQNKARMLCAAYEEISEWLEQY